MHVCGRPGCGGCSDFDGGEPGVDGLPRLELTASAPGEVGQVPRRVFFFTFASLDRLAVRVQEQGCALTTEGYPHGSACRPKIPPDALRRRHLPSHWGVDCAAGPQPGPHP